MDEKKKRNWLLWILLVIVSPIGIIYMWITQKSFSSMKKMILTVVFAFWFILCISINNSGSDKTKVDQPVSEVVEVNTEIKSEAESETQTELETTVLAAPADDSAAPADDSAAPSDDSAASADDSAASATLTMGQENALAKAQDYLDYSSFSYSGLIAQLEYEGFSTEDSTYAADNCGADWNEQAAAKAQEYLDYSSFSRDSLIEQLEYEGFTSDQAEYGATAVGY